MDKFQKKYWRRYTQKAAYYNDYFWVELKHKTQMLIMVQNKHTFVERLFIEPVIKKIGFHITIPFLVLPYSD